MNIIVNPDKSGSCVQQNIKEAPNVGVYSITL